MRTATLAIYLVAKKQQKWGNQSKNEDNNDDDDDDDEQTFQRFDANEINQHQP